MTDGNVANVDNSKDDNAQIEKNSDTKIDNDLRDGANKDGKSECNKVYKFFLLKFETLKIYHFKYFKLFNLKNILNIENIF